MGDACPHFQNLIDTGFLDDCKKKAEDNGNKIIFFNAGVNGGGCGYKLTNYAIQNASGKYFIFYANDDVILPNHMESYLSEIEKSNYDFMYYDSYLDPISSIRNVQLGYCQIGHSELVVRTEFMKSITPHSDRYGHDWEIISEMMGKGLFKKGEVQNLTYRVMRLPNQGTKDKID